MPNYYAHLTFGQRVLADLPAGLSELIEQEREAFDLGCLGPDPLFFYQPIRPKRRPAGGDQDAPPLRPCPRWSVCARLSRTAYPCPPATELASSCHLALDSACHGYVDDRAADGPISHMAIEGAV